MRESERKYTDPAAQSVRETERKMKSRLEAATPRFHQRAGWS